MCWFDSVIFHQRSKFSARGESIIKQSPKKRNTLQFVNVVLIFFYIELIFVSFTLNVNINKLLAHKWKKPAYFANWTVFCMYMYIEISLLVIMSDKNLAFYDTINLYIKFILRKYFISLLWSNVIACFHDDVRTLQ